MPYWASFSRVGAVPQVAPSKQKRQYERRDRRRKGITMEDLKNQTAIRLAKEQRQSEVLAFGSDGPSSSNSNPSQTQASPSQVGSQVEHLAHTPYQATRQEYRHDSSPTPMQSQLPVVRSPARYTRDQCVDYRQLSSSGTPSLDPSTQPTSKNCGKTKLPHGLTVNELKEMTKARLQAETNRNENGDTTSQSAISEYQESPLPPVLHSCPEISTSRSLAGSEAWDTASVSTVTSEYLRHESAHPPAVKNLSSHSVDEFNAAPFGRSRSHPNTGVASTKEIAPLDSGINCLSGPNSSSISHFESSAGYGNRRRAATLSPRPMLTYLHEDRPSFHGQKTPNTPTLPASAIVDSSSQLIPIHVPDTSNGRISNLFGGAEFNRARTSSTASLPAVSHTRDEFPGRFGHLREDAPSSSAVTGLKDVFREPPTGRASVPALSRRNNSDYILARPSSTALIVSADSFDNPRDRAATWGEPTTNMFGPGLITNNQENLADDLATILNLSVEDHSDDCDLALYPPRGR